MLRPVEHTVIRSLGLSDVHLSMSSGHTALTEKRAIGTRRPFRPRCHHVDVDGNRPPPRLDAFEPFATGNRRRSCALNVVVERIEAHVMA